MENKENLDVNQRPPQIPQIPEDQQQQFIYPGFPTPGQGPFPWYGGGRQPWYGRGQYPWYGGGHQPWYGGGQYPWYGGGRQPWYGGGQYPWYGGGRQPWDGGGQSPWYRPQYPWGIPYTQEAEGVDDSIDSLDFDDTNEEANTEQFWFGIGYPGLGYPGLGLYPGLGFGYPGLGIYPGIGFGYPWRYYHRPYWRRRWW